ncbi:zinc-dependent metalloprotease [Flavivirga eckloniae]|uniref:Zinc-dependent metalloprotease n=1 Tax=Flavivirga eckloniae TaxID=1803846 RepID=A0A2K9PMJ6_9FLAO|nr:zinc-dependent metalloprotease [Flavivirga eckloniae]AUP78282.1 hypothetical protein C1H87_05955 [Flavivirga eckloniae]
MRSYIKIATLMLYIISVQSYAQKIMNNVKPYQEVITSEIMTQKGFLLTHLLNNKLYLEIPSAILNKAMLFVEHHKYSNPQQVKWEKRGNRIHLIISEIESKVGGVIPVTKKTSKDKFDVKITPAIFPILTIGANGSSYVIDVSSLFLSTPKPLSGRGKVYQDLAFIDKVLTFDNVIEVKTSKTFSSEQGPLTVNIDFSLFLLPSPMMPRLYNYRIGFGKEEDYLNPVMERASITRWRLVKKNKEQVLSEPIKPITFYYDPATPEKWKPYLKAGVEEWLQAFEAAGFKNAIVIKEPPINDRNFSINSLRYSFIRWLDRTNYRGYGSGGAGSVNNYIDKRTGEILKGDILIGAPYEYLSDKYFIRCSPLDKRAQQYPFPDDLMGELIQRITAHEAGHVFGLKDGHYGEYAYPFEKMRDKEWLEKMGHTPSVMNYTQQNSVVQPEDSIPPILLNQKVGPTDVYSIRWGYTSFQNIKTPDDELPYLEKIIKEQDSIPWYKYKLDVRDRNSRFGPDATSQVVDCDNPIKVTTLGLENLKRVIKLLPKAVHNERDNIALKRLYFKTLNHWVNEMKSIVSLVGGYTTQHKGSNQKGAVYNAISTEIQKEAVEFLIKEAFNKPDWLILPEITRKFETNSTLENITNRQLRVLRSLFFHQRLRNLEEMDLTMKRSYKIIDLLNDLQVGLWHELDEKTVKINPYRQQIQLAYIMILKQSLEIDNKKRLVVNSGLDKAFVQYKLSNYTRAILFNALFVVKKAIKKVKNTIKEPITKKHLELCLMEINKTPKID